MDALVAVIVVSNAFLARDCLSQHITSFQTSDLITAMTVARGCLNDNREGGPSRLLEHPGNYGRVYEALKKIYGAMLDIWD